MIKEILSRKSKLESDIDTIDNHMARAEARGFTTMSIDGYYPISISVAEAESILIARRERYKSELDKINEVIGAMEEMAESMLTDEEP
nr:MAG TPA: hypothetical protein [Caudoviricetes sp.]